MDTDYRKKLIKHIAILFQDKFEACFSPVFPKCEGCPGERFYDVQEYCPFFRNPKDATKRGTIKEIRNNTLKIMKKNNITEEDLFEELL